MIRMEAEEYFIEPLERGGQELEERGRVHVVYRRSAVLRGPSDGADDYRAPGRRRPPLTAAAPAKKNAVCHATACSSLDLPSSRLCTIELKRA